MNRKTEKKIKQGNKSKGSEKRNVESRSPYSAGAYGDGNKKREFVVEAG